MGELLGSGIVGAWEHYWGMGLLRYGNTIRKWDCWGMGTLLGCGTVGVWEHY